MLTNSNSNTVLSNNSLSEIALLVNGKLIGKNVNFSGIAIDSRQVQPNNLFIAIKGEQLDGMDFIPDAIKNGATCLLVQKEIDPKILSNKDLKAKISYVIVPNTTTALGLIAKFHREKFNPKILALTGSSGKTTTRYMLANILSLAGNTLNPEKNYNNEIGLPLTLLNLNAMHKFAVLEMGACKEGDIKYLMNIIQPNVTMITNIGPVHLASMKDLDGVSRAKGEAYEFLARDGTAVVNIDEIYAPYLLTRLKDQNIITYGLNNKEASVYAKNIEQVANGTKFTIVINEDLINIDPSFKNIEISLPVPGMHNVINAIACTASVIALGVSLKHVKTGLETFKSVVRRLAIYDGINNAKIIDDSYNANPVSVRYAISVLAADLNKRKIFIFADMLELGEQTKEYHKEIGIISKAHGINNLFTFGDLAKYASDNFGNDGKFYTSKAALLQDVKQMLNKDTTVLIKGSNGMKMDEIVKELVAK